MKIIELLNKIANGEEVPYKIKYNERIFEYAEEMKWYLRDDMKCELSNSKKSLNDEVEIIEEKKILEKLEEPRFNKGRYYIKDINGDDSEISGIERTFRLKINEIIDYLEENK